MALTITLTPEVEAQLRRRAERERRTPEELVADWVKAKAAEAETPGQAFVRRVEEMRKSLPDTGPLPDAAFDRATAYQD